MAVVVVAVLVLEGAVLGGRVWLLQEVAVVVVVLVAVHGALRWAGLALSFAT